MDTNCRQRCRDRSCSYCDPSSVGSVHRRLYSRLCLRCLSSTKKKNRVVRRAMLTEQTLATPRRPAVDAVYRVPFCRKSNRLPQFAVLFGATSISCGRHCRLLWLGECSCACACVCACVLEQRYVDTAGSLLLTSQPSVLFSGELLLWFKYDQSGVSIRLTTNYIAAYSFSFFLVSLSSIFVDNFKPRQK